MQVEQYYDYFLRHALRDFNQIAYSFGGMNPGNDPSLAAASLAYGKYKIGEGTWRCLLQLHQVIAADHNMQKTTITAIPFEFNYIEDVLYEIEAIIDFEDQTSGTDKVHRFEKLKLTELAEHYKYYLSKRTRDGNYAAHETLSEHVSKKANLGTPSYLLFQKGVNEGLGAVLSHNYRMGVNIANF